MVERRSRSVREGAGKWARKVAAEIFSALLDEASPALAAEAVATTCDECHARQQRKSRAKLEAMSRQICLAPTSKAAGGRTEKIRKNLSYVRTLF
jgi:hypothetical protein